MLGGLSGQGDIVLFLVEKGPFYSAFIAAKLGEYIKILSD